MRQLVTDANQLAARVRDLQAKLGGSTSENDKTNHAEAIDALAARLFSESVRYGKPGLQAHITYLAGMTTGADQKIGRDAVERYTTLRADLDNLRAEVDRIVVTPASTFSSAASRSVRIPSRRAASKISGTAVCRATSPRSRSVIGMI
jgi:hypothetical protein